MMIGLGCNRAEGRGRLSAKEKRSGTRPERYSAFMVANVYDL